MKKRIMGYFLFIAVIGFLSAGGNVEQDASEDETVRNMVRVAVSILPQKGPVERIGDISKRTAMRRNIMMMKKVTRNTITTTTEHRTHTFGSVRPSLKP